MASLRQRESCQQGPRARQQRGRPGKVMMPTLRLDPEPAPLHERVLDGVGLGKRSSEEWADLIARAVNRAGAAAFEAGTLLLQAKADVGHGNWDHWIRDHLTI